MTRCRTVMMVALLAVVPACKKLGGSSGGPASSGSAGAAAAPAGGGSVVPAVAPADGWSDEVAKVDLTVFYNMTAEWSGRFILAKVIQMRVDRVSDTQRVAHVEYGFEPVRSNPREAGTDRRTFEFVKEGAKWVVKSMGGNESASFGAEAEGWSDEEAAKQVAAFYDTRGEWKGKFKMAKIQRYRVDRKGAGKKIVYVEYAFEPEPGNKKPAGVDKRSFFFSRGPGWKVDRMGAFMSAAAALKR